MKMEAQKSKFHIPERLSNLKRKTEAGRLPATPFHFFPVDLLLILANKEWTTPVFSIL